MKRKIFLMMLFLLIVSCSQQSDSCKISNSYLGQKSPGETPELFAPGIISTDRTEHGTVTFTPDGKEIFWAVIFNDPFRKKIMTMKNDNGKWGTPKIANFSMGQNEGNPFCSPDGNAVFFTGWCSGEGFNKEKHLIMVSQKSDTGWSASEIIDPKINSISKFWQVSSSQSGNLYFYSEMSEGGIFKSEFINGEYSSPEKINLNISGSTPYIASDESFIIFSASNQSDSFGEIDLYISYKMKDGSWSIAKNLGEKINSGTTDIWPVMSPDKKYLFFTSSRNGNMDIFWVNTDFIEKLKPSHLK